MDRPGVTKRAGEILVSEITMQLAGGCGLDFEDRAQVEPRGVTGTRRLYALCPPKTAAEAR